MIPIYAAKAELFRVLGHPARIRVLELLSVQDHAVHELLAEIDIEPSNLSQQLAVLRRVGLVTQRRAAGEVVYSLTVPEVRDLLLAGRGILAKVSEATTQAIQEAAGVDGRSAGRAASPTSRSRSG